MLAVTFTSSKGDSIGWNIQYMIQCWLDLFPFNTWDGIDWNFLHQIHETPFVGTFYIQYTRHNWLELFTSKTYMRQSDTLDSIGWNFLRQQSRETADSRKDVSSKKDQIYVLYHS